MSVDIDLIIPFHQVNNLLIECIKSIEAQKNFKPNVIFIDDRKSQGDLPSIMSELASQIITTGGVGYSRAIRIGIEQIQSPYAAFLDSDDTMHPNRLSLQLATLIETGSSLNYCKIKNITADGKFRRAKLGELNTPNKLLPLLLGSYGANSSWVFTSELTRNSSFMNTDELSIDWITALKMYPSIKTSFTAEYLYNYRRNPGQMTNLSIYKTKAFSEVYPHWKNLSDSLGLPELSLEEAQSVSTPTIGSRWNSRIANWIDAYLENASIEDSSNFSQYKICLGARQILSHANVFNILRSDNKNHIHNYMRYYFDA